MGYKAVCSYVCVQHGANVNAMDLWQFTPLHEAASKNRAEVTTSSEPTETPAYF